MRPRHPANLAGWLFSKLIPIQPIDLDAINAHIRRLAEEEAEAETQSRQGLNRGPRTTQPGAR